MRRHTSFLVASLIASLLFSFTLSSCLEQLEKLDKIEDITLQPFIDFPLVNSEFTMEEFLTEGESKAQITTQQGLLVLTYDDTIATPQAEAFFNLPDQQSPTLSITGPEVSFPSPGASFIISKSLDFNFAPDQSENLDSILIKAGQLAIQINSTFPADIDLTIDIPSIKISGNSFQQNFTFSGPASQNSPTNLQGAVIDLTDNGTTTNTLSFTITATITDTGQPINNTHRIDLSFGLTSLSFRGLFGQLGTRPFQAAADSINVDIFNNTNSGSFNLLAPLINLTVDNSFGLPVGFDIQNFSVIKSDNSTITLSGAAVNTPLNPYTIAAPTYAQLGQSIQTQISINANNSNINQLVSSLPSYLVYQFEGQLNPNATSAKNFVLDTSRMNIAVHLELPFYGSISALSLSKRYTFEGLGIDDVLQSTIKIKTINEFPVDAFLQVYFVDNTTVLDSLFTNRSVLEGAQVDSNDFTQGSAEVISEVLVSPEKVQRIEQATALVINAVIFTSNLGTEPVKFSIDDKLKVNIGVHTRLKAKLTE